MLLPPFSLEKSYHKINNSDQFFLKAFIVTEKGTLECQGYIYFYINFDEKESQFIGLYVKPEYRGNGISTLLISAWIDLCLNNNIIGLTTNKRQRKPFLLYLLKTFDFEIENFESYETMPNTIYICRNGQTSTKYLMFKNKEQEATFAQGSIMREDNYQIIGSISDEIILLDKVLLSTPYNLENENKAFTRSRQIQEKHKN